jgi:hypothetical protein
MLQAGTITLPEQRHRDTYGNIIPSRADVAAQNDIAKRSKLGWKH